MLKELFSVFKKDNLLMQSYQRSYQMLEITREMYNEARTNLRMAENNKLKINIYDSDIAVNKYEREVRRNVLSHLVVSGGSDINPSLVLVSIIIDIERIGDYTKNIVQLAQNHPEKLKGGLYEDDLKEIENAVDDLFGQVREVFESADGDKAQTLLDRYAWVNGLCDQHMIDYICSRDSSVSSGDAVSLALYYRYLKRINSHLRNIASSVVNPFDRIGFYRKPDKS